MKTILVTGCLGYIGCRLVPRLLGAGHRVIGVDSLRYNNGKCLLGVLGHPRFDFHKLNVVADAAAVRRLATRADDIIPLAALVGAPVCERNPQEAEAVNTAAIADLAGSLSISQRILYPNTNSGYGTSGLDRELTEEDSLAPISVYGATKVKGEDFVRRHRNYVSLRLATVFGLSPRMRFDLMVNDFCRKVHSLEDNPSGTLELFEPHYRRNFVHVDDVASAFLHLLEGPDTGPFNVGNPECNMTKFELAKTVCDGAGVTRKVIRFADGRDPDQRDYVVSNAKLLNTGFQFEHGIREGIGQVLTFLRSGVNTVRMSNL